MSNVAIKAEGLGKQYRIGGRHERYYTLRDTLTEAFTAPFKRARSLLSGQAYGAAGLEETIWALNNVSFEIGHGEVVGIIGRNGAGKSTLLKVLSRITEPTTGFVDLYGRVGSLLEVGTGFHPELTGRENIYLNGAILGMSREEIERKFDEIVDFADVEKFIDTPVKHYSSGMGLRLGFAVAAHLEPEILVVDEVLAVGDAQFQKRCLGKMSEVASQGRTVLFVSHNMAAIQNLCQRTILLDDGQIARDGRTIDVVSHYLTTAVTKTDRRIWNDRNTAPGNNVVRLSEATVRIAGTTSNALGITMRTPIDVEVGIWNLEQGAMLHFVFHFFNEQGIIAFGSANIERSGGHSEPLDTGLYRATCHIPGGLLNEGTYTVALLVVRDGTRGIFRLDNLVSFEVLDDPDAKRTWYGKRVGVVRPVLDWTVEHCGIDG